MKLGTYSQILLLLLFLLSGLDSHTLHAAETAIANPASTYCEKQEGKLIVRTLEDGSQVGECRLSTGEVCEEWALFRGDCGPGGHIADPWTHCHDQKNGGVISTRRTNEAFPEELASAMINANLVSPTAAASMKESNRWRCMNGQVWVCTIGNNLPCEEKADLSRSPTTAMIDFCQANPSATIPAYVTGRATVYSWECKEAAPQILRQLFTPDDAGFLSEFWFRLPTPIPPAKRSD